MGLNGFKSKTMMFFIAMLALSVLLMGYISFSQSKAALKKETLNNPRWVRIQFRKNKGRGPSFCNRAWLDEFFMPKAISKVGLGISL